MNLKDVMVIGACILALAITLLADRGFFAVNSSDTAESESITEKQEPTIDTTAENIFNAYDRNEVAADQEYTGRNIRVKGVVTAINSTPDNTAQVLLATKNQFMSVKAEGDAEFDARAAALIKGREVVMTCKGAGEFMGSPRLEQCRIH